jgi:hypothetical protein
MFMKGNIFLVALPSVSYYADTPGWLIFAAQLLSTNKSYRGTALT